MYFCGWVRSDDGGLTNSDRGEGIARHPTATNFRRIDQRRSFMHLMKQTARPMEEMGRQGGLP